MRLNPTACSARLRFMYVIYPFIPVAAAVTIATLPDFTPACLRKKFDWLMTTYKVRGGCQTEAAPLQLVNQ